MRGLKILSTGRNKTLRQPFGCLRFTSISHVLYKSCTQSTSHAMHVTVA